MKALNTLVRLYKQRLDEARSHLVALEKRRAGFLAARDRIDETLAAERKAAAASIEAGRTFAAYARRVTAARADIDDDLAALAVEIERAADAVAAAFRNLKKYEITLERRIARARAAEARVDQAQLDEVGITRFRRREG